MTRTKHLSSNPLSLDNLFPSDGFKEVLSPLVEPETDKDSALVDEHLKVQDTRSAMLAPHPASRIIKPTR